ncbi:MAG: rhodanese-like domain-containing protein [Dongiaceae bacterium]
MANLDGSRIAARFDRAVHGRNSGPPAGPATPAVGAEELQAMLERQEPIELLDVCLPDDFAVATGMLPTARHVDPADIATAAATLRGRPVVVYCVYGFEVSQDAAAALRANGIDARHLAGGMATWRAMGGRTVPKPEGDLQRSGGETS